MKIYNHKVGAKTFFSAVPFGFIAAMAFYIKKPYIVTACLNGIEFHLDFTIRSAWVPKGCNHFFVLTPFQITGRLTFLDTQFLLCI